VKFCILCVLGFLKSAFRSVCFTLCCLHYMFYWKFHCVSLCFIISFIACFTVCFSLCFTVYYIICFSVCFIVCVFLELNEEFDGILRRNEDVVKEAIKNLNTQTSQRPLDTDWWTNVIGCILQLICMTQTGPHLSPIRSCSEKFYLFLALYTCHGRVCQLDTLCLRKNAPSLKRYSSKFALFSVSGLKDKKLIKKQAYAKTETCKLYSRVFWIFLPNFINIDRYNFELYRFKVDAFFETLCILKTRSSATAERQRVS